MTASLAAIFSSERSYLARMKRIKLVGSLFHLVGVIWTGRWAGERKERISEVTL